MGTKKAYALGLASGLLLAAGGAALANNADVPPLAMDQLRAVVEIWRRIQAEYVDPVDDNRMARGCISGMAGLDPQSAYLDEAEFRDMSRPSDSMAGVGLEMTIRDNQALIIAAIDNGPAARAGVRSG